MARFLIVMGLAFALVSPAAADKGDAPVSIALVVQDHCAPGTEIPLVPLTDSLSAKLSGCGFRVINPYNVVGENENRMPKGERLPETSAVELGKSLGADGVLTASVIELIDLPIGSPVRFHQYAVRMTFNLADAKSGSVVCGETIKVISPRYTERQSATIRTSIVNDLLHGAAEECASRLAAKAKDWKPVRAAPVPPKPIPPTVVGHPRPEPGFPGGPRPSPVPHPPISPGDLTIQELDSAAQELIKEMIESRQFRLNYAAATNRLAETGAERLPIAVMGGLVDLTKVEACAELVDAENASVRVLLFKSDLFDVKDDSVISGLTKRILAAGNSPLEDGAVMEALKKHGSPDFFVVGDLRKFGMTYRFRLAVHDLSNGKVLWEGIHDITK